MDWKQADNRRRLENEPQELLWSFRANPPHSKDDLLGRWAEAWIEWSRLDAGEPVATQDSYQDRMDQICEEFYTEPDDDTASVTFIGLVDRVHHGRRSNDHPDYHQQHIENTIVLRPWKVEGSDAIDQGELWLTCSGPSMAASRLTPRDLWVTRVQVDDRLNIVRRLPGSQETDDFTSFVLTASPTARDEERQVPDVLRQRPIELDQLGVVYPIYYPLDRRALSPMKWQYSGLYVLEDFASKAIPQGTAGIRFGVNRLREGDNEVDLVASAIRNFGSPPSSLRDELAMGAWHHFGLMNERADYGWKSGDAPTGPEEVWDYISIFNDSLEATIHDGTAFVLVHTYPVWEEEHGMVFVLENGIKLVGFNSNGDGTSIFDEWKWPPPTQT